MSRCPSCHGPVSPEDFQCPRCELLLNAEARPPDAPEREVSVVRALLSIPERTPGSGVARPPALAWDMASTVRFPLSVDGETVPRVVAGVDLALTPLHAFEAYLVSLIDGAQTVHQIAAAARLRDVEVTAVLHSLGTRRVVELPVSPEPARATTEPELPAQPPPPKPAAPPARPPAPAPARPAPPASTPSRGLSPASRPPATPSRGVSPGSGALPLNASRNAPNALQRAVELERKGDVPGAIEVLKRGIASTARPAPLYNRLALILLHQRKDYAQAEQLLRRALDEDPDNPVYEQNLMKVVALAAASSGPHRAKGLFSRLTGKK